MARRFASGSAGADRSVQVSRDIPTRCPVRILFRRSQSQTGIQAMREQTAATTHSRRRRGRRMYKSTNAQSGANGKTPMYRAVVARAQAHAASRRYLLFPVLEKSANP